MKNNCSHYRIESKTRYVYHPITGQPIKQNGTVGVCWGTKEIDECSCDGDRSKCSFYPKIREKARFNEDCLIVSFDFNPPNDVATLMVAIKDGDNIKVINELRNEDALEIYDKLIYG